MPIAFALFGARFPYILFGVAAALFVTWKHKENMGRLVDGVEPRLGEKLPLAGEDDAGQVTLPDGGGGPHLEAVVAGAAPARGDRCGRGGVKRRRVHAQSA